MVTYHMIIASMSTSGTINVNNKYVTENVTELSENIFGKINKAIALG